MTVVFVADNVAMPVGMAMTAFIRDLGRGLLHAGVPVHVITTRGTEYPHRICNTRPSGVVDGITFEYIAGTPFAPVFPKDRLRERIRFWLRFPRRIHELRRERGPLCLVFAGHDFADLRATRRIARWLRTPLALCLVEWLPALPARDPGVRRNAAAFTRGIPRNADAFVVCSRFLQEKVRAMCAPASPPILHLPVPCSMEPPPPPPPSPYPWPYVLYMADIKSYMGPASFLVDTLAHLPAEMHLVMMGKAPRETQDILHARARSAGVADRLVFSGIVSRDTDVGRYWAPLQNAQALLVPMEDNDRDRARMPNKIMDYILAGRPIVSNTVGDMTCWFQDGVNALLAPPGDARAMARCILRSMDPALADRVVAGASALAAGHFDFRIVGRRLALFLRGLSAAAAVPAPPSIPPDAAYP